MFAPRTPDAKTRVRVGTGVIVLDSDGRMLLERRGDCGWWGFIGGKVDPGESIVECAVREAREETGLTVEILEFVGLYSDPGTHIVTYPDNGDVVHLVDVVVTARVLSGSLTISPESLDLRFFAPDQIPYHELVPPAVLPLADFLAGRRGVLN
jgi:8-oxo-dGTP pyrophosphatase MutT (NUDIX family)